MASTPSAISSPAPEPDDADAEHALRAGLDHELRQSVGAIERHRAARCAPRELRDLDADGLCFFACFSVRPHQAISGSVKTTAGIAAGSKTTSLAVNGFDRDAALMRRLVREHRLARDVADREDRRFGGLQPRVDLDEAARVRPSTFVFSSPGIAEFGLRPTDTSTLSNSSSRRSRSSFSSDTWSPSASSRMRDYLRARAARASHMARRASPAR